MKLSEEQKKLIGNSIWISSWKRIWTTLNWRRVGTLTVQYIRGKRVVTCYHVNAWTTCYAHDLQMNKILPAEINHSLGKMRDINRLKNRNLKKSIEHFMEKMINWAKRITIIQNGGEMPYKRIALKGDIILKKDYQ